MRDLFVIAGCGSYEDRGCEAVVRGTVEIISRYYEDPFFVVCGEFSSRGQFEQQVRNEKDTRIRHVRMHRLPWGLLSRMLPVHRREFKYRKLARSIPKSAAVLWAGCRALDSDPEKREDLCDLDDLSAAYGRKLVLWGASFSRSWPKPVFEPPMSRRLGIQAALFCVESSSIEFLKTIGVENNVFQVCDPAFALQAQEPGDAWRYGDLSRSIGVCLGPGFADRLAQGDKEGWLETACHLTRAIASAGHPVALVPYNCEPDANEFLFLRSVASRLQNHDVCLIQPHHSAAEIKWLIGRMVLFCGTNPDAMVAALTARVPAIALACGQREIGIHHDIFGHRGYCLGPGDTDPVKVMLAVTTALLSREQVRETLEKKMGEMIWEAYKNGKLLRSINTVFDRPDRMDRLSRYDDSPRLYGLRTARAARRLFAQSGQALFGRIFRGWRPEGRT
ncbi:MAG: polysaccharide pyruvyl transferase family protein [Deltaproteobacteria bacterium]